MALIGCIYPIASRSKLKMNREVPDLYSPQDNIYRPHTSVAGFVGGSEELEALRMLILSVRV